MIFTTEGFFEVAIESWPEWGLNPRPYIKFHNIKSSTKFHSSYIAGGICLTSLVDGKYGNWSVWTVCTKSCGGGLQSRTRDCNNPPPSAKRKDCQGPSIETRSCSNSYCEGLILFSCKISSITILYIVDRKLHPKFYENELC